jgi:alpha-N-arabinofuranosidase
MALTAIVCGASASRNEEPIAWFDWFEYHGGDPVDRSSTPGPSMYRNPILAGFYPDPSITRAGDEYYLVTSSFAYFPGVPIFQSRDLVSWRQIGHVLDRPSQLKLDGLGISRGIFAPTIRYHRGTFYTITTLVDGGGNFLVTATNAAGPWSDPVWLPEIDGIDPSLFFDEDGRAYITNNGPPPEAPRYDGHRAIWIQEFDPAAQKLVGPRSVLVNGGVDISRKPIWIEAPHIFNVDGAYYLIAAEGGTGYDHSEVVFRSASVRGPYVPYGGNPILTQRHLDPRRPDPVTSAGHADFVQLPNGDWWAVFLACRPYGDDLYNTGRETFMMPVRWVDGWPVIARGSELVPHAHARPSLPPQPPPPIPLNGTFTLRDEFDRPALAPYWMFIRTPHERWHDLQSRPGSLGIRARPERLGTPAQPSFVGRRQQHAHASASTLVDFTPDRPGDRAGLAAFQSDDYYYLLALAAPDGRRVVQLEQRAGSLHGGRSAVLAAAPLPPGGGPVYLKIDARADRYDFSYALEPGRWIVLHANADGTILSTRIAGGFVGATFGMYAGSDQVR